MVVIKEISIKLGCPINGYYLRWYKDGWHHWFFKSSSEDFRTEGELYNSNGYTSLKLGDNSLSKSELISIRSILSAIYIEIYTADGWKAASLNSETWQIGKANSNSGAVEFNINVWLRDGGIAPVVPIPEPTTFYWINYLGTHIINHNSNRIIFKRPA